jgi:acetyl-CoA C-acetyltransferase
MRDAVIVEAVRTPIGKGKPGGALSSVHPVELLAHTLRTLVERSGIDPALVDDVVGGTVDQVGEQAMNTTRYAVLSAGFPETVPATTVDRQCGSSQQAVHFAAQAILSGTADVVVAGGVQNMSAIPISAAMTVGEQFGFPDPFSGSLGWRARYGDTPVSQFRSAQMIAEKWNLSRADMEAFALRSHERAVAAVDSGRFAAEILPLGDASTDTCPRRDTSLEKMAALPPLEEGGMVTAAVASQICDGAAALLVMSERAVREHGVTPRARIHHLSVRAADPIWMLTAPIPATAHALSRTGLSIHDIDRFEVNEAFASVVLAWERELHPDMSRVNVNGGAIALGHPLGCSGGKLMTTLLHELERTKKRFGLQTMCIGFGQGIATIIERV